MNPDWIEAEAKPCQGFFTGQARSYNVAPVDLREKEDQLFRRSSDFVTEYNLYISATGDHPQEFRKLAKELEEFLRERGFQPKLFA